MSSAPRRPGLIRHPDFVKLWSAETISQFGTQVSLLALPLIAATFLNVPPFEFALLATFEFLPFILLSLPAGVWVDRLRRRPILIVTDIGRGLALLSVPVAVFFDALTIWQLYVVGFAIGCMTVFFDVAYQSYLPALVEREDLVEGNSKLEISRSAAQIAGPGTAGVLISLVTAPVAIVLDAISFMASAFFVLAIRRHESIPARSSTVAGGKGPGMRTEIAEGLRYVLGNRFLRTIAASTGLFNLAGTVATSILLLYLVRQLGFTPELLGITFSIGAVGFLVGAVLSSRIAARFGVGRTIVGSMMLAGPALLPVALAPADLALPFVAAGGFVGGMGGAVYNINQVSFRQAITPERMQGRMNATMRFIVWGTIPLGTILGGFLGGFIGLHETIWVGAIASLFAFIPVTLGPVRSILKMPEPEGPARVGDRDGNDPSDVTGEAVDETPRAVVGSPPASLDEA
ncbi:MAG: MFS transporter [Chloroflexota bacterium]|nr:MFS transporter [Chloroflexota bacterium]